MAIVWDQKVEVSCGYENRYWLSDLGYTWNHRNDKINVKLEDIRPTSKLKISGICDYCNKEFKYTFYKLINKHKHFCSEKCRLKYIDKDPSNLKKYLLKFYNERKRSPRWIDFFELEDYPHPNEYLSVFKKWNIALKSCSLQKVYRKDMSDEELRIEAIEFYNRTSRSPYNNELAYSVAVYLKGFNGWNHFLSRCGLEESRGERVLYNKEYGIRIITDFYNKHSRIPFGVDFDSMGINKSWITGTFGSARNALIVSGLIGEKDMPTHEEKADNGIAFIKEFYNQNKRPPTVDEYNHVAKNGNRMTWSRNLVERYNKKYSQICSEAIGHKDYSCSNMIGNLSVDKNGELCRSYKERMISNLLIDNRLNFSKEVKYSDIYANVKEGYIADWYLKDYCILIELFGMYFHNSKPSDKIAYEYKLKTESKIEICNKNNIKLLPIFKKDTPQKIIQKFFDLGVNIEITEDFAML